MRNQEINFYSAGIQVAGILHMPDDEGRHPGIVQGPGWLGLKDASLYAPYHEALTSAGFAVLIFDYRGFGDSGGERGALSPSGQLEDLINSVTYLQTRPDIYSDRIGAFGSGGTGGGNAVLLAAQDHRVRCSVAQVPVADGRDWLKRMRREYEWVEFLQALDEDRRRRVTTGSGEMVHPREKIMVPTPERDRTAVKKDVDDRIPLVPLAAAEEIIAYRPIDHAGRVSHLMVIGVENDVVTPTDHAIALYEAAQDPKRLILQRGTTHYAAYQQHADVVIPEIVEWYRRHLTERAVERWSDAGKEILKESG